VIRFQDTVRAIQNRQLLPHFDTSR
jgi:hypothetical protein